MHSHQQFKNVCQAAGFEIGAAKKRAEDAEAALTEAQAEISQLRNLAVELEVSQKRAGNAERALAEAQSQLSRASDLDSGDPFALILIDGDGYVFNEVLLHGGVQAGANAAHHLRGQILKLFQNDWSRFKGARHWRYMVRIYLNLEGLSKKLHTTGIVPGTYFRVLLSFLDSQEGVNAHYVGLVSERYIM